jgi:hypothetical protein
LGVWLWGAAAVRWGISSALVAAGIGLVIGVATVFVFPLRGVDSLDLKPAGDWPQPNISGELDAGAGPTFVTVEYKLSHQW